jgi:hypothetical protein
MKRKREVIKKQTRTLSLASHLFICWLSLTLLPASNDRILCLLVVLMHSVQLFPLSLFSTRLRTHQTLCVYAKECIQTISKATLKSCHCRGAQSFHGCANKGGRYFLLLSDKLLRSLEKGTDGLVPYQQITDETAVALKRQTTTIIHPRVHSPCFLFAVSQLTSNWTQSERQVLMMIVCKRQPTLSHRY